MVELIFNYSLQNITLKLGGGSFRDSTQADSNGGTNNNINEYNNELFGKSCSIEGSGKYYGYGGFENRSESELFLLKHITLDVSINETGDAAVVLLHSHSLQHIAWPEGPLKIFAESPILANKTIKFSLDTAATSKYPG